MRCLRLLCIALVAASGWVLGFSWGEGSSWTVFFAGTTLTACAELIWCDWLMIRERLLDSPGGPGGEEAGLPDD